MATGRLPDPNSSPLTAKGDLYTYSTVPAKLAVGNNGETLVADSSASQGLRWQSNFAAGKNKLINGDFSIWQRGTSFTNPAGASYTADRIRISDTGGSPTSRTITRETFTAGSAPVAGYEAEFFYRSTLTTVGPSTAVRSQSIVEDVRILAGQTVTLSFWAKSDSSRTQPAPEIVQNFGSGGSTNVDTTLTSFNTTTAWQRFSFTFTMPSVSGKTIGSGSHLRIGILQNLTNGSVLDMWGLQLEAGNVATAFQTATGTLAGELAAARRYYYRLNSADSSSAYMYFCNGNADTTTLGLFTVPMPVRMRTTPIVGASTTANQFMIYDAGTIRTCTAVPAVDASGPDVVGINASTTGLTAGRGVALRANNSNAGFIDFSAEL